ncbi:hypothetical protein NST63_18175 [Heyndrickxia sp. FSL W8-0496]
MKQPPDEVMKKILYFFAKTSVPRILKEERNKEKIQQQKEVS